MSINEEFKTILYREIEKRFDGDENALVETLMKESAVDKIDFSLNNAISSIDHTKDNILNLAGKFKNHKGDKLFPQIYIPNFEKLRERKKLRMKSKEQVVFVVYTDETKNDKYPGYILGEDGKLIKLSYLIDENYTQKHEVWVINFNERVLGQNDLKSGTQVKHQARSNGASEFMAQLRITDLGAVEGWPAGDLELRITVSSQRAGKLKEFYMNDGKLPRSWVRDQKWWLPYYWLFSWYPQDYGNFIGVQWIEFDEGGEGELSSTLTFPYDEGIQHSTTIKVTYDDNDEDLGYATIHFNDSVFQLYYGNHIEWYMDSF